MIRLLALAATLGTISLSAAIAGFVAGPKVLLARGRTEPIVAVDPRNPRTIVVGSNTDYGVPVGGTYPVEAFSSRDGGGHFAASSVPVLRPYTIGADPGVAIDRNGTVFFSYLGEAPTYCSNGPSAILMTHSTDGGRSFEALVTVDQHSNDDKPWMAVRSIAKHPSHLYVAWTRWLQHSGDLLYSRSTDGGAHFSSPIRFYSSHQDNAGAQPATGPHGRVYVVWASFSDAGSTRSVPTSIFVRTSSDDGVHFGSARSISGTFRGVPHMSQPDSLRNLTFPSVSVGAHGAVVVAWSQVRKDLGAGRTEDDVMVSRSTDGGRHWSAPRRVNDAFNGDRFMPALVTLGGGRFAIAFYDRRAGPSALRVYAATLNFKHGFHVSANVRVDTGWSPVSDIQYLAPGSTCFTPGRFFGDYIGMNACGHELCVVWSDTALRNANETDLWFRRVPTPVIGSGAATRVRRDASMRRKLSQFSP